MVQDIAKLEDEAKEINQVDICFNCKNEMITSFTVDVRPAENQERLLARLIKLVQPIVPLAAADGYADVNQGSDFSQLGRSGAGREAESIPGTLQCVNCIQ